MVENLQNIPEPPVQPDDTRPTGTFPQVELAEEMVDEGLQPPQWRQIIGLLSLIGAVGFTIAAMAVLFLPRHDEPVVVAPDTALSTAATLPTATTGALIVPQGGTADSALPSLDPAVAAALLQSPLILVDTREAGSVYRDMFKPFTIIPDRPRNEVVQYTVAQGDTISAIADRFGLQSETIAWSNPRRIVQVLRPGDTLNIPPVDGVLITAIGSTRTIADYAQLYKVDDPYLIIDSPFNDLADYTPNLVPPNGTQIFIPGGQAEEIVWSITITGGDEGTPGGGGAGTSVTPAEVSFQTESPGSCGRQPAIGGSFWTNPLPPGSYVITQGFGYHTGLDLGGALGTPVYAANAGRVVFAGWDVFGYGNMVAIVHGPNYLTLYGHLDQILTRCGEDVVSGQQIGTMGNTGNSSGVHLHFEIRSRQGNGFIAGDPSYTIPF